MKHLFIVGAQRSGSTYLYHLLDSHPQILMAKPVRPEPKYFLEESKYSQTIDSYYKNYFSERRGDEVYFGEKSTSYIENPNAMRRILVQFPEAKVMVILRDPVERAWSNYCFSCDNGIEKTSFADAINNESTRNGTVHSTSANPFTYVSRGYYSRYIEQLQPIVPEEQLKVLIFEEVISSFLEIEDVYRWLKVDISHRPDVDAEKRNASSFHGQLSSSEFKYLVKIYQTDLLKLESLLGRKIDVWKQSWKELKL